MRTAGFCSIMVRSSRNIKSFFESITSSSQFPPQSDLPVLPTDPTSVGDGCTEAEPRSIETLSPGLWQPQRDYEDVSIAELAPGPRRVSFTARVVSVYDQSVHSKMQDSAKGCLKITVKDHSALILVCQSWILVIYHSC